MHSTPHSSVAATGHFVEAERLVEALPLLSKRGEWDHQARLATIHAPLAIAASLLDPASCPRESRRRRRHVAETVRTEPTGATYRFDRGGAFHCR